MTTEEMMAKRNAEYKKFNSGCLAFMFPIITLLVFLGCQEEVKKPASVTIRQTDSSKVVITQDEKDSSVVFIERYDTAGTLRSGGTYGGWADSLRKLEIDTLERYRYWMSDGKDR